MTYFTSIYILKGYRFDLFKKLSKHFKNHLSVQ